MRRITAWLHHTMIIIRGWLGQIGAAPRQLWHRMRTRAATLFRRPRPAEAEIATVGSSGDKEPARWQQFWAGVQRGLRPVGKGFGDLWQLVKPLFVRLLRLGQHRTGLIIRKIGVKRHYRYTLDPTPLHQLLADVANALAMVIGLGAWPYQRAWFAVTLPPLLAPHDWILSALLSVLPLMVFYLRWQTMRQQNPTMTWDLLTIATGWLGLFLALFAGSLMFAAFTATTATTTALICAILAIAAWLVGEAANAYTILIRRPRPRLALLSLSKSLLFILSGWLILIYLLVVNLLTATIQLESAAFLFTIFCATAFLGLLSALVAYGWQRFNIKWPRLVSITN